MVKKLQIRLAFPYIEAEKVPVTSSNLATARLYPSVVCSLLA